MGAGPFTHPLLRFYQSYLGRSGGIIVNGIILEREHDPSFAESIIALAYAVNQSAFQIKVDGKESQSLGNSGLSTIMITIL